jgi:nitroimidazol reductase NimA-like FMN-containing flavoprotein (pyridoxamine 5'-phosphate oxidase superfamily)
VVIVIGPEELSRAECERHLRDEVTCRVAVCTDAGPHIVPANYAFVQDMLILQTTPDSTLGSHASGQPVAVEVDDLSPIYHAGWSVVVRGRAERVTDPDLIERLEREGLRPWAPGERALRLGLRLAECEVSGRTLRPRSIRRSE